MKLVILVVITTLGLVMPLFWLVGCVSGLIYYYRHQREMATGKEPAIILSPQLGLTMADGGDAITEEKKEKKVENGAKKA